VCSLTALLLAAATGIVTGDERGAQPLPIPLTRPEMKQYLEDLKARKPRIPLPELTQAEKAKQGERGGGYEGRLRTLYMPPGDARGTYFGFASNSDPMASLETTFKTELFWLVSRINNCQY
jgi:hypothetical protein